MRNVECVSRSQRESRRISSWSQTARTRLLLDGLEHAVDLLDVPLELLDLSSQLSERLVGPLELGRRVTLNG
jgi:hypothetical protein